MASGLANDGTILLQSSYNDDTDELATGSGSFTNDADGTIQVNKGSGATGVIAGTLVNKGLINVDGGAFSYVSGTLNNQGTVAVDSSSYFYVNGTYDEDGGNITGPGYINNSAIYINVSPATPITIAIEDTGNTLETNNLPNVTLWVQGTTYDSNATLNVASGLANDGTILLQSSYNDDTDELNTGSGSFTNDADGTIQVNKGSGATGVIAGTLVNKGLINVDGGAFSYVSGTLNNQGTVAVDSTSYFYVNGAYDEDGGNITGPGYINNSAIYINVSPATPITIAIEDTGNTLETNNLPNVTLWVQGNTYDANATLNVASGLANDGTILLQSSYNDDTDELATGSGSFTNDADGTIQVNKGSGATGVIAGTLVNKGLINVDGGAYSYVSGTLNNQGTVAVDSTSYFYVNGAYDEDGGNITGPGYINNSAIYINVSPATPITIAIEDTGNTLETNNLPNVTLWVQGTTYDSNATLNVASGLANDGTILLQSSYNDDTDELNTGSGSFTNDADGTIQVNKGSGATGVIAGTLVNKGLINVDGGAFSYVSGTLNNQGTVAVDSTSYFYVNGAYDEDGGNITGPGYINNSAIYINVSPATPITIAIEDTGNTLETNNLPNVTLWVQGTTYDSNATLNVASGLANDGTILLQSSYNDDTDELNTGSGSFTNDADGTIQVNKGSGATGVIAGTLINAGTVDVDTSTTFGATGANLTNTGLLSIAGATVTVTGTSFTNGAGGVVSGYGTLNTSGVTVNDTGGTVQAIGGTLNLTNSGFVSSGTLGVGTWLVGPASTLTISGVSSISTLSSIVALQGSGATFSGISSLSKITAGGQLELQNEAFTTAGNLDNAGTIDLAPVR